MALDTHAKQVLQMMAAAGHPPLNELPPDQARVGAKMGFAALQGKPAAVASVKDVNATGPAGEIPVRVYRPAGSAATDVLPACLYFHGGGFVIGDIEMYDTLCRMLCNASGCAVLSVEYRLAPEAPYPAAVEDCWAATQWAVAQAKALAIDPARLGVAGDSAGGNLAAVVALMARDAGGPALRHQLLIYPATQLGEETASMRANAEGYFLTAALMDYFIRHYLGGNTEAASDWKLSPQRATSHAGLPPASVLVCGFDPLHDDGVTYAEQLKAAGVQVRLMRLPSQIHGFLSMDGAIPAVAPTLQQLGRELAEAMQ